MNAAIILNKIRKTVGGYRIGNNGSSRTGIKGNLGSERDESVAID